MEETISSTQMQVTRIVIVFPYDQFANWMWKFDDFPIEHGEFPVCKRFLIFQNVTGYQTDGHAPLK